MADQGRTLLRFDNVPDHPGVDRHRYHTPAGVLDDIESTSRRDYLQEFYDATDDHREERHHARVTDFQPIGRYQHRRPRRVSGDRDR